ncbi:MAG TPA: hypothetical protein VEO54_19720 [Thermoanaerobaculia bacterium]|nr:hypothetical protein [Thermoanaerobaculia bacterium]
MRYDGCKYISGELTRTHPLAVALDYFGGTPGPATGSWSGFVTIEHERLPFTMKEGKWSLSYPFTVRAGTKRLAGTMTASGIERGRAEAAPYVERVSRDTHARRRTGFSPS